MINERDYNSGKDPYGATAIIIKYSNGDISLEKGIPTVRLSKEDTIHTVVEGETLQNIAYRYYGDSGYWYQIMEANSIVNPFSSNEFYPGLQLIIPKYGLVE